MKFSQIAGQNKLGVKLRQGAQSGRVPHAQMFLGAEGCGNLALALAYAQYLCCAERTEDDSCGQCSSCRKFQSLTHPDLHFSFPYYSEDKNLATDFYPQWRAAVIDNPYMDYQLWMQLLDAKSKQGNIPVRECHAILHNLSLKPFEANYKILIMWLPEYLGTEGNVLLKAIEEPSENTIFLMVAENTEKILTTILSRTQLVRVPPVEDEEVAKYLQVHKELGENEARQIAMMSSGNMLRALELSSSAENQFLEPFRNWMGFCYRKKLNEAMEWANEFSGLGRDQLKGFFLYSMEILRAILVHPFLGDKHGLSEKEEDFVSKFSKILNSPAKIEQLYSWLNDAAYEIERNANAKIVIMDISFKLTRILK